MADEDENSVSAGARRISAELLGFPGSFIEDAGEIPDDELTGSLRAAGYPPPLFPYGAYRYKRHGAQTVLGTFEKAERLDRKTNQRVAVTDDKGKQREDFYRIASPFAVTHSLRYHGEPDLEGLRIAVQGSRNKKIEVDVPRGDLVESKLYLRRLMECGLRPHDKRAIAAIVELASPRDEILILPSAGWHRIPGWSSDFDTKTTPVFACPGGEIIGGTDVLEAEINRLLVMDKAVAKRGSLKAWQAAAELVFAEADAPHLQIGILAGFAGVLLSLAGLDSTGIVFTGTSSRGKSTAQALAASAWSTPDTGKPGLFQNARSTNNALEPLIARGDGTVFALDDLAHVADSGKLGELVFMIAGGTGKQRMRPEGGLRAVQSWHTYVLLSYEKRLSDAVREKGGQWTPGSGASNP